MNPEITDNEKELILNSFNDTACSYEDGVTIHELFERTAARCPDSPALLYKEQTMSYAEFNGKANSLARVIREKVGKADTLVAIIAERSFEMMLGIMAILKAGCGYLPINPDHPARRVNYIIENSEAPLILTMGKFREQAESAGVPYLELEDKELYMNDESNLEPLADSRNLAYVIYTSGSTGEPKGVMIEHRSVINRLNWMQKGYPLSESDVIMQKTPYDFDVSVWELFWWGFQGASVCLLEPGYQKSPAAIIDAIEQSKVSVMHFVPSLLNIFLDYLEDGTDLERLSSLKNVFASGEALPLTSVNRFNSLLYKRGARLINLYGPTEATVDVSYFDCSTGEELELIPIGKPIDNIKLFVVDPETFKLLPVGAEGELCIYGDGLARGYMKRAELTAKTFVDCPFFAGEKMYRTGDLARWLPDGNIEYLGRIDHQVKIRGFRIELGEIENKLLEHPSIKQAVVTAMEFEKRGRLLSAYLVGEERLETAELREHLLKEVPDYMVPSFFTYMDDIPLTSSGKADRKALPRPVVGKAHCGCLPKGELESIIASIWEKVLHLDSVGVKSNFFDLGGTSLDLATVNKELNKALSREIEPFAMFEYYTVEALAAYLRSEDESGERRSDVDDRIRRRNARLKSLLCKKDSRDGTNGFEIAIIGMSGRFPGAKTIDELWENLKNEVESVIHFTDEELLAEGIDPETVNNPDYIKAKGWLADVDQFDAPFFGYTPKETLIMDPQTRLFHEECWKAMEHAGYDPARYPGTIGLYAGANQNQPWETSANLAVDNTASEKFYAIILGDRDFMSTRVSYKMDLHGPVYFVQTACSTSLTSIHVAARAILTGECDMAIAGGSSILLPNKQGFLYQEGMIQSKDGHCRPFDAGARGMVFGDGVAAVVLKRLDDAIADGDTIHAVLKSTGINNDGDRKVGYPAPSVDGQAELIKITQDLADVTPESISYVETHGTGTIMGDPIEFQGLKKGFDTDKKQYCAIGSIKSNIGHLDAVAGIAGIIKSVLCLKHRQIPASINYKSPNPKIDFANSPFYVNDKLRDWEFEGGPLRAAINSFGVGGTNAHAILEEAPKTAPSGKESRTHKLITLSAKSTGALKRMRRELLNYLKENPDINLADAAFTMKMGRKSFNHRGMIVGSTLEEVVMQLDDKEGKEPVVNSLKKDNPPVVFMFTGQGSQYINMGIGIYKEEKRFAAIVDRCFKLVKEISGHDLKSIVFPAAGEEQSEQINQTEIVQPLIFTFEYALASLLISWGVKVDSMIGHSIGEYAAAAVAGVFSLEDALRLVCARGRLMQSAEPGAMLSVRMGRDELEPLLSEGVTIAALNSSGLSVVSGDFAAIDRFEAKMKEEGHPAVRLHTSHAFHSPMMNPIIEAFKAEFAKVKANKPQIPFVSNLTGKWITDAEVASADYWADHLRSAVRFADGLELLFEKDDRLYVEVGAGNTLSTFVRMHEKKPAAVGIINMVRHPKEREEDTAYLTDRLGRLWLHGVEMDWESYYYEEQRKRVPLPTYSFDPHKFSVKLKQMGMKMDGATQADEVEFELVGKEESCSNRKAPTNPVEEKLHEIFCEALGLQEISIDDSFLELGGNSLMAIMVLGKINKSLGIEVPLADFFQYQTIEELAKHGGDFSKKAHISIGKAPELERYQMSSIEKRMYLMQQMNPGSVFYNVASVFSVDGKLDKERVEEIFRSIINRYEILRTSFFMEEGETYQRVLTPEEVNFEVETYSSTEEDIEATLDSFVRPHDLEKPPLIRVALINISEYRLYFAMDINHIACDDISVELILKEFTALYKGEEIAEPALQYRDYSEWHRDYKESQTLQEQKSFWLKKLNPLPEPLNLPTDFKRPPAKNFKGRTAGFVLTPEEYEALKSMAGRHESTPYMVILSSLYIMLAKLSGNEEITVGTPVSGRNSVELQDMQGAFINTLVLRSTPDGKKRYNEYLKEITKSTLEALSRQDYPIDDLLEHLDVERDLSRNPLFDVMLILNSDYPALDIPGLKFTHANYKKKTSMFDLTVWVRDVDKKLLVDFEYSTSLFSAETIRRFLTYFKTLLAKVVSEQKMTLEQIEFIPAGEREAILTEYNATEVELGANTVNELIDRQVKQSGDSIALSGPTLLLKDSLDLSYRDLGRKSTILAKSLRDKGLGPDSLIGIMLPRSIEMVVAVVAVLKAGGAYVPLDPEYPAERIEYIMAHSRAKLILTSKTLEQELKGELEPIYIEDIISKNDEKVELEDLNSPQDLAYIIYTSGTTGKPKGVAIEHRNVVNFIKGTTDKIEFRPGKSILAVTTISFDIFVLETLLSLAHGLKVVVAGEDELREPELLRNLITREGINMLQFTPSRMKLLLTGAEEGVKLDSVTDLMLGGEALPPELFKEIKSIYKGKIYNMYGPTETTVWSSIKDLTDEQEITIGEPIANTQLYVLDKKGKLQPPGVLGELHIGGAGLARGYHNNQVLTADRFVESPFPGSKLIYKTGDIAKWLPGGDIAIEGRVDHQVKVRGFRVELGEIEVKLKEHSAVKDAVVVAGGEGGSNSFLAGYVVLKSKEATVTGADLNEYLAAFLPDYMLPAQYGFIDKIPLTPNGKIDRKKLPSLELKESTDYAAPRDDKDEKLEGLFQEVLGVKTRIGIDDNFFTIGGQSLKAAVLAGKIKDAFGKKITMAEIFKGKSIRGINDLLHEQGSGDVAPVVVLNQSQTRQIFTFPNRNEHGLIQYTYFAESLKDYAVATFDYLIYDDEIKDDKKIVDSYIERLLTVKPTGPYVLLGHCFGGMLTFEIARELEKRGHKVSDIIIMDATLAKTPLGLNAEMTEETFKFNKMEQAISNFVAILRRSNVPLYKTYRWVLEYSLFLKNRKEVSKLKVDANIHYIVSPDRMGVNKWLIRPWSKATRNKFTFKEGFGDHVSMFKQGNVERNAEIVNEILKGIFNSELKSTGGKSKK